MCDTDPVDELASHLWERLTTQEQSSINYCNDVDELAKHIRRHTETTVREATAEEQLAARTSGLTTSYQADALLSRGFSAEEILDAAEWVTSNHLVLLWINAIEMVDTWVEEPPIRACCDCVTIFGHDSIHEHDEHSVVTFGEDGGPE